MVKDENRYLGEWIQFHLLVGATKIVIYDDNSTVSPAVAAKGFAENVIVHKVQDLPGLPANLLGPGKHNYIQRQYWSFNHCGSSYGHGKGWLAVIDVDEYIFPCRRRHNSSSLWDAVNERLPNSSIPALKVECLKFGFNDVARPLHEHELQIEHHTQRYVRLIGLSITSGC
jgi:hypothetical protein